MSEEMKFSFGDGDEAQEPEFEPSAEYATYQIVAMRKVDFKAGASITLPDVLIDGQPYTRNGLQEGGRYQAIFLKITKTDSQGQEYSFILVLMNNSFAMQKEDIEKLPVSRLSDKQLKQLEKDDFAYVSAWSNMQRAAIEQAPKATREALQMGKPVHAKALLHTYDKRPKIDRDTGEEVKDENGNPEYWYDQFRYGFEEFDTRLALRAAEQEYWDNRQNGTSENVGFKYPVSPTDWTSSIDAMREYALTQYQATNDIATVASQVGLTALAKDADGNPVKYKAILADILSIPEAMVNV